MILAGFYVHIPFCRQACRYCDFHFSVSLKYKSDIIDALIREIEHKKNIFRNLKFESLYFGGGTPSVLSIDEINRVIVKIHENFQFKDNHEFTFEANPDDLKPDYLEGLVEQGINRLSIGIQSFRDEDLILMRRSHNSRQAIESLINAKKKGISNINADLIYGIPGLTSGEWKSNLEKLFDLNIPHISAYHLTFEPGTVFDHWRKKGRISPINENISLKQFKILKSETTKNNFVHYEISNFGKKGFFSRHNILYWKQKPYVGIGPSAHSYDGNRRFWNVSNNKKYTEELQKNSGNYLEYEALTNDDRYNEYILTGLRTIWGIELNEIGRRFGDNYVKYTRKIIEEKIEAGLLIFDNNKIILSTEGIFLADQVVREFFRV